MKVLLAFCFLCFVPLSDLLADPIFVITAKKTKIEAITLEFKGLFTGNSTLDNTNLFPVDYSESSELHTRFVNTVLDKSPTQYRKLWFRLLLTGHVSTPDSSSNTEKAMVNYVSKKTNAIGFVFNKPVSDSVRAIGEFDL